MYIMKKITIVEYLEYFGSLSFAVLLTVLFGYFYLRPSIPNVPAHINAQWVISEAPTMLIWSSKDFTRSNLESEEPKCGIGINGFTGEIYERYNFVNVTINYTLNDIIDYNNVDSTVIKIFTNYGYKDKQEISSIDVWIKISYKLVKENNWVYIERINKNGNN